MFATTRSYYCSAHTRAHKQPSVHWCAHHTVFAMFLFGGGALRCCPGKQCVQSHRRGVRVSIVRPVFDHNDVYLYVYLIVCVHLGNLLFVRLVLYCVWGCFVCCYPVRLCPNLLDVRQHAQLCFVTSIEPTLVAVLLGGMTGCSVRALISGSKGLGGWGAMTAAARLLFGSAPFLFGWQVIFRQGPADTFRLFSWQRLTRCFLVRLSFFIPPTPHIR